MEFGKYDIHLQNLLQSIEQKVTEERCLAVEECDELFELSQQMNDNALAGFACLYRGDIYCNNYRDEDATMFLTQAVQYLKDAEEWDMLVQCYNEMGVLFQYQGDMSKAIDSFYAGVDVAEEHQKDIVVSGSGIYMNFSSLCENADDFEKALYFRLKSFESVERLKESPSRNDYMIAISAMLVRLYLKMGYLDDAKNQMDQLGKLEKKYDQVTNGFEVYVNKLEFARQTKDEALEIEMLDKTMQAFHSCENLIEYYDECQELIEYLKCKNDANLLEQVLDYMTEWLGSNLLSAKTFKEIKWKILKEQIQLYKSLGDEQQQFEKLKNIFEMEQQQDDDRKESMRTLLKLRNTLRQTEVEKMFLLQQADTDALTGIPNRRKMNEKADQMFEKAKKKKTRFGIVMLDVDNFKSCNDVYGHHMGDKCLVTLAEILKEQNQQLQFPFRYGGDEFMILFDDFTDEEIIMRCEEIRAKMNIRGRKLGMGQLTLSMGAVNLIPKKENRIWDYTLTADETLYWVKRNGRNKVKLVNNTTQLKLEEA